LSPDLLLKANVLLVSTGRGEPPNRPEGGVENETFKLANSLANHVSSVHYVENLGAAELPETVYIHRVKPVLRARRKTFMAEVATSPILAYRVASAARQTLTENSIHLIHFHETRGNLPILFLSGLRKIPMVLTVHGPVPWTVQYKSRMEALARNATYRLFDRRAFGRVNYLIAISHWIKKNLLMLGVPDEKVSVVYNPVDTSVFSAELNQEENSRILNRFELEPSSYYITVGSLVSRKRHIDLIRAFNLYKGEKKLVIVGDGPEFGKIRRLICRLNLSNRTKLFRYVSPGLLPHLYAGAQAFVTFSLAEGLPAAVSEAMSSGLGIIAPDTPWIRELVGSDNGFLFAPSQTIATTDAFDFFDDNYSAKQYGLCSRRIAEENFSLLACTAKTLDIYRSILDSQT